MWSLLNGDRYAVGADYIAITDADAAFWQPPDRSSCLHRIYSVMLRIYRGYIGIMEKKMEASIVSCGIYRSYVGIGKENGNYYSIIG